MADIDADLVTALKQSKSKKMFFAFVPKGSDGKLIVSKAKIPAKEIADAKKEIGGGNPVSGKCFGPINNMVFLVAKAVPPTLGPALKKGTKRDSGLAVIPDIQLNTDADAEEEDTADAAAGAGGHGLTGGPAPPRRSVRAPNYGRSAARSFRTLNASPRSLMTAR